MLSPRISGGIVIVVVGLATGFGCGTKAAACRDLPAQLDPLTREFDQVEALEPKQPISGDPATCAAYGGAAEKMDAVTQKLGALALSIKDEPLKRRIAKYEEHGAGWASAARKTQEACSRRDSKAMTQAMGDVFHHGAQTRFVIADVNSYCRNP